MEDHKKETGLHPIIVWIIASILLHILFVVVSIVLKIDQHRKEIDLKKTDIKKDMRLSTQDKQQAIMMLDQPKKPQPPQAAPTPKQAPKQIPPAQKTPPLVHTLIPGRQGIDKQNLIDDDGGAQTPELIKHKSPENEQAQPPISKKTSPPIPQDVDQLKTEQPKTEIVSTQSIEKKDSPKDSHHDTSSTTTFHSKGQEEASTKTITTKKTIRNEIKQTIENSPPISKPKALLKQSSSTNDDEESTPYPFSPKPKTTSRMSLKDLQIGFDNYRKNIGNSQYLIQQGNTSAAADGQSLKMITYNNQFAKTMIGSIQTHPQYQAIQYNRGKQIVVYITIDRQGTLLDLKVIAGSGDTLIDKIMVESIQSAGLYPAVPSFVLDDPFSQRWTILH